MLRTNRLVQYLAIITGIVLFQSCSDEPEREDIHFIVAGHICGGLNDTLGGLYPSFETYLMKKDKDKSLDMAFFTGDIVYKCDEPSWDLVDKVIKKLKHPVYFAPGNQDLRDQALYEKRYGKTDQYFEKGNNLFIIWEVTKNGWNVSENQLNEYLKLTSEKEYDNVFIFTHQVIWYDQRLTPQTIPNDIEGKAQVSTFYPATIQALSQKETPVYLFAGDVGSNPNGGEISIHQYKNIRMISSGMGSGKWDNVLDIQVKNGKVKVTLEYLNGSKPLTFTDQQFVPIVF